jgi:hypothetical protein
MSLAKIFCVSKDEYDLIEDFIVYYGEIFGYENVIIIDNMSTNTHVLNVYAKYKSFGITVVQTPSYQGNGQGDAFTSVMKQYVDKCDFLIGLDTDEFLILDSCVLHNTYIDKTDITNYLKQLPVDATLFKISLYYNSIIDENDESYVNNKHVRPTTNQKTFYRNHSITKVFYRSSAFISTGNGNHSGSVSFGNDHNITDLGFLHFHDTGIKRQFERAQQVIYGYNYVDSNMHYSEQLKVLKQNNYGNGFHRVFEYIVFLIRKYILMLFIEHIKRLPDHNEFDFHVNEALSQNPDIIDTKFAYCREALESLNKPILEITIDDEEKYIFKKLNQCEAVYMRLFKEADLDPNIHHYVFNGLSQFFVK